MKVIFTLAGVLLLFAIGWSAFSRAGINKPVIKKAEKNITTLTLEQELGKKIFFDPALSNPTGQSCASCHAPGKAFADPANRNISPGASPHKFGHRNASAVTYAAYTPPLTYDSVEETYSGGLFWDGRANTLAEQALGPLLNPLEMNTTKEQLYQKIQKAPYKNVFLKVYGEQALNNPELASAKIAQAIAAFEKTKEVNPFTSKFDYYKQGKAQLTQEELLGLKLFEDPKKGNCAACHPTQKDEKTGKVLFTDFTYDNIGLPAGEEIKARKKDNYQPDLGLGAIVKDRKQNGKFRVPSLRNVAITGPYFHNGSFKTLEETVQFYNQRNSGKFGPPEVNENVNQDELGNLKLTEPEVKAITAFMKTLTDGYKPE
jgi:cytochrome c peroxidase